MNIRLPLLLVTVFGACKGPQLEQHSTRAIDASMIQEQASEVPAPNPVVTVLEEPKWVGQLTNQEAAQPLPAASQDLVFAEGEEPSLLVLLKRWSEVTGVGALVNGEAGHVLAATAASIPASRLIPAAEVQSFVQMQLAHNDCFLVRVGSPDAELVVVQLSSGKIGSRLRSAAVFVESENLAAFEHQYALLIQTVLDVPSSDVRQLATSMRSLLTDTTTQNMIAVSQTSIVLQGTGSTVGHLARTIAGMIKNDLELRARLVGGR